MSSDLREDHVAINDLDEFDVTAPTDTDNTANIVDENAAAGAIIGITASASDADGTNNTVTYSLASDNTGTAYNGPFTIDPNTGVVTVKAGYDPADLKYVATTNESKSFWVKSTSSDGSVAYAQFTVDINAAVVATDDGRDPSGLIGIMTSNTGVFNGQTVTVQAHNEEGAAYAAWKAVDGVDADPTNNTNSWAGKLLAASGSGNVIGWYKIDLGQATTLYEYDLKSIVNNTYGKEAKAWTFEGSDDGINWTIIDTQTNQSNWGSSETRGFTLSQPETYRYFRFNITENNGDTQWVGFDGFQMYTMITVEETDANHVFDVLANDVDPDGGPNALSISAVTDAVDGSGNVVGTVRVVNGQVEFTPNGSLADGATEAISFTYTVTDGRTTDTEVVNFFLKGHYDAITANADNEQSVLENTDITLTEDELVANINNPENATLTLSNLSVTNGTATDNGNGSWTFSPTAGFNGVMDITYDVSDGTTTVASSTNVLVLNQVPGATAGDDTLNGTAIADFINGLVGNDTLSGDAGNDTLVGGKGSDTLTGGTGSDTFQFNFGDEGQAGTPFTDSITDFEVNSDKIDLSDLLAANNIDTGVVAADYIDLSEDNNGDMVIAIHTGGDGTQVDQEIVLKGTTINDVYGSDSTGISEADILQKMIDDQNILL